MYQTIKQAKDALQDTICVYYDDLYEHSDYNRIWRDKAYEDAIQEGNIIGEKAVVMPQSEISKYGDDINDVIHCLADDAANATPHNVDGASPYEVIRAAAWVKIFELKSAFPAMEAA